MFHCSVCQLFVAELQKSPCGHFFCNNCVTLIFEKNEKRKTTNKFPKDSNHESEAICPEGCKKKFRRSELKPQICEVQLVFCPRGCGKQIKRDDLFRHLKEKCDDSVESSRSNLSSTALKKCEMLISLEEIINSKIETIKGELQKDFVETFKSALIQIGKVVEEKATKAESNLAKLDEQYKDLNKEMQIFRNFIIESNLNSVKVDNFRTSKLQAKELKDPEIQLKNATELIEKFESSFLTKYEKFEKELQKLELKITSPPKIFLWEVKEFTKKMRNVLYCSDSFFSHEYGYKMRLNIMPTKNNLEIFICLLKGPWDQFLTWPCKYKADIVLLNHKTDHHLQKHAFDAAREDVEVVSRPSDEINWAWHAVKYVSMYDLRKTYLLLNDTLLIKVSVIIKK